MNAFATGASKRSSIVAVSSALLSQMNRRETQGVLAHEVSHIANGDMVTMTLLQGILNTFVIFLSRVAGYFIEGLEKLKSIVEGRHFVDERAQSLSTLKISGKSSMMALFSTQPPP